jgi:high-affinity iron transporter
MPSTGIYNSAVTDYLRMGFNFRFALLLAVAIGPTPLNGQDDAAAIARRVATVSSIAADEYALGVSDGRVVSQAELTEARLFLGEARDAAARLPAPVRDDARRRLERLLDQARRLDDPALVRAAVDDLRRALSAGLGVQLDPLPTAAPSLARGERLYQATCASCHGAAGAGDGVAAASLNPPPSDLTDAGALSGAGPLDFFRKITVGVAGTAMSGYESRLTLEERWALAAYTSGLRRTGDRGRGAAWVVDRCPDCALLLSDFNRMAGVSDDSLAALLAGVAGQRPPEEALGFARVAGAAELLGGDRALAVRRVAARVAGIIDEVVALADRGERDLAQSRALEAYLEFEAVERDVGARSGGAVAGVERAFARLRAAAVEGRLVPERAAEARDALDRAVRAAAPRGTLILAGQSLLIILREGLEAILIVGALMTFLVRSGAPDRMREIGLGVLLGVGASLATAVAFATVIRVTAAQQEAIEGVTMLIASVVLFSVASWMVSRIEADKWRAFVQARMREALSGGGAFALGGVAFLAVYREGVETVLFYAALFGTADAAGGQMGIVTGLIVGSALLALVYVAIRRWGLRLPLKPFFAVTGLLLTVMAVSFAGQGVAELQAAGWVPATPIALPAIPALGVFPTLQTLLAQLVLAGAFVAALSWILWLGPRAGARFRT